MFYNLLKEGKKITVKDLNGVYTATTFFYEDVTGKVIYRNKELGEARHDAFSNYPHLFNNHILRMMLEKFYINIED